MVMRSQNPHQPQPPESGRRSSSALVIRYSGRDGMPVTLGRPAGAIKPRALDDGRPAAGLAVVRIERLDRQGAAPWSFCPLCVRGQP